MPLSKDDLISEVARPEQIVGVGKDAWSLVVTTAELLVSVVSTRIGEVDPSVVSK